MYFINWNDTFYLPHIKRHYGRFCDKIIMYDNYSTNDSVEVAEKLGMEVRFFGIPGELNDAEYLKVKNNCWKEAKGFADYVIVCDVDEFLHHPFIGDMLRVCFTKKISIPLIRGFDMYSKDLPSKDILEIKTGIRSKKYSKNIIFDPNAIEDINYGFGAHNIYPSGRKKVGGYFNMLHYRNIGGLGNALDRHKIYKERLSAFNKQNNYGKEYKFDEEKMIANWNKNLAKSKSIDFNNFPFSRLNFFRGISANNPL